MMRRLRLNRLSTMRPTSSRPVTLLAMSLLLALALPGCHQETPRPDPHATASADDPGALTHYLERVDDGDSFHTRDAQGRTWRIRIAGIDAPEKGQRWAVRSAQNLTRLLEDRPLKILVQTTDPWGRLVADVRVATRDIGLMQIEQGFAWHFKRYAQDQPAEQRTRYAEAEQAARAVPRGLWEDQDAEPPWDYRARQRDHAPQDDTRR